MAKKADKPQADDEAAGEVARWVTEIRLYDKEAEKWTEQSKKIIRRYKDERKTNNTKVRFNILWSNIQTLSPALFAKNPKPNVERRFQDDDDVGRLASEAIERGVSYFIDDKVYDCLREVVNDRLLCGRGTAWVRYVPNFASQGTEEVTDDAALPEVYSEECVLDYVHWQDFGCKWGRTWEETNAAWRRVFLDKGELEKRFPEKYKTIPLDHAPEKMNDEKIEGAAKKATIYEIWDKKNKKVLWIHKDVSTPLDEKDDPLKLKDFFPFPRPLFATLANDTIIPVPDYIEYQDQANEIDELTARVALLIKAVKVAGVYCAEAEGIQRILSEGLENKLVPVDNWAMFAEKGGLKGMIEYLPLGEIVAAITALYEARDKIKHDLYEISGLSDILRGDGDSQETATGVKTKSQFATLRLNAMQGEVARFCRDVVRIMADIICRHFSDDTIKKLSGLKLMTAQEKQQFQMMQQLQQQQAQQAQASGQQPQPTPPVDEKTQEMLSDPTWEEVIALLRDDTMRCFRIDIETDSTIKADQEADRQARIEFLTAAGGFLQQAVTIPNPELMPLLMQMLMFGVRGFPVGKELESAFKVAQKKIQNEADNPQPKQDPEMIKTQGMLELEKMKMGMQQQQTQASITIEQAKAQKNAELEQQRMQVDNQQATQQAAQQRDIDDRKLQHEGLKLSLQHALELQKIKSQEKIARVKATAGSSNADVQSDDAGLVDDDEGPTKLDQMVQSSQQAQQQMQQLLPQLEQQMQALLKMEQGQQALLQGIQQAVSAINAPRRVVRDASGRVQGSEVVNNAG